MPHPGDQHHLRIRNRGCGVLAAGRRKKRIVGPVNDEGRRRDRGEPCPAVSSHPNCCELTSEPPRSRTSSNLLAEESAAGLFVEWMSSARDAPREGNAVIEEARLVQDGIG